MIPIISLVSGTYNRLALLTAMVQSFRDNLLPGMAYEIVLVDGGSTDGTIEWAKAQTDIKLIEDGALLGAISAFTRGAHAASGKYVLLSNDDVQFKPGSVLPAIVHLENVTTCGAVAFKDNRRVNSTYDTTVYKTLQMEGNLNGRRYGIIYAQVGLFRSWLGKRCNWWQGEHDEMLGAAVYAGDNSLSAQIWHYGYTVDEVSECIVEDFVAHDELRKINYEKGLESNDSHFFYDQWPEGVIVSPVPTLVQQDRRAARILYMPIYEPGWAIQKHPVHGKHGLRDALARGKNKYGAQNIVQEFDYLADNPTRLRSHLMEIAEAFKPDLILTQIQSPLPLTADILKELVARTGATIVNWNGDQAPGGLYSREMLPILRQIDLQLITNLDVVADYEREHIKWDYWQIGYEDFEGDLEAQLDAYYQSIGQENPFKGYPNYPVVYLASLRSADRQAIARIVQENGGYVFSPGDGYATLYDFVKAKYIYQHAKIAISDNGFTSRGFVSNRLFQALAAGGCVVLQQHVDRLDELTGLKADVHYVRWHNISSLPQLIEMALKREEDVKEIATVGTAFVREYFSFDAQVAKLMDLLKKHLGTSEALNNAIALRWIGRGDSPGGLGNTYPSGMRYEHRPGQLLYIKQEDINEFMRLNSAANWERMEV